MTPLRRSSQTFEKTNIFIVLNVISSVVSKLVLSTLAIRLVRTPRSPQALYRKATLPGRTLVCSCRWDPNLPCSRRLGPFSRNRCLLSISSHRRLPIHLAVRPSAFIRPMPASVLAAVNGLLSDVPASHGASPTHSHSGGNPLKRLTPAVVPAWNRPTWLCTMDRCLQPRCGRRPRCRLFRRYQSHGGVSADSGNSH